MLFFIISHEIGCDGKLGRKIGHENIKKANKKYPTFPTHLKPQILHSHTCEYYNADHSTRTHKKINNHKPHPTKKTLHHKPTENPKNDIKYDI